MIDTTSQVDRLGERLRSGSVSEADLRALDGYRRSFGSAYEGVIEILRHDLGLEPTGRPAKSTSSIVSKLRRESVRLSQIQDIAGCRVIVTDTIEQDRTLASLRTVFPKGVVVDRRTTPSHGYRAIHLIVRRDGRAVEIQLRNRLQHMWAELSEKLSDMYGTSLKYGGGPPNISDLLSELSAFFADTESSESEIVEIRAALSAEHENGLDDAQVKALLAKLDRVEHKLIEGRAYITARIQALIRAS